MTHKQKEKTRRPHNQLQTIKHQAKNTQESLHKEAKTTQKANQERIKHIAEHKPSKGQTSTPSQQTPMMQPK